METVAKTIQSQATAPVNKTCSLKKTVAVTKAPAKPGLWRLPASPDTLLCNSQFTTFPALSSLHPALGMDGVAPGLETAMEEAFAPFSAPPGWICPR